MHVKLQNVEKRVYLFVYKDYLWMEISRISELLSYNEFVENYLSKNCPCLFDENFTRNWRSRKEWITQGKPNFDFLKEAFGRIAYIS